jgi:hypothetical protein
LNLLTPYILAGCLWRSQRGWTSLPKARVLALTLIQPYWLRLLASRNEGKSGQKRIWSQDIAA